MSSGGFPVPSEPAKDTDMHMITENADDIIDANERTEEAAAARCEFQLTYGRAKDKRELHRDGIMGGSIDNAWHGHEPKASRKAPGDWSNGMGPYLDEQGRWRLVTEDEWIDSFASSAINEAVHEALEWMRVDGKPWLDPHGPAESAIYRRVNDLCAALAKLRALGDSARNA